MPPLQVTKRTLCRAPLFPHYLHLTGRCGFSWAPSALKRYRRNENLQAEMEEMQEEQRSLSSVQSVSVWGLLTDPCVRWQVITIAVVNIGMQLSGIDAVSLNSACAFTCM